MASSLSQTLRGWKRAVHEEARFAYEASHELRTPLAVIQGAAELADSFADDPARVREVLKRVRDANRQMEELVSVFLWLGREDSISSEQGVDLGEVVEDCIDSLASRIPNALDLRPQVHQPDSIDAPRILVFTVVRNLLENALVHGERGTIGIELRGTKLCVTNLSEERAPSAERFGFGLSIVERICRRRGWIFRLERDGASFLAEIDFHRTRDEPA